MQSSGHLRGEILRYRRLTGGEVFIGLTLVEKETLAGAAKVYIRQL
jgi:hypothetical protein